MIIVVSLFCAAPFIATAQPVVGTTTFNNNFSMAGSLVGNTANTVTVTNVGNTGESNGILASGWDFTASSPGGTVNISAFGSGANPGGTSDYCIRANASTANFYIQTIGAKSTTATTFGLQSVYLKLNITTGGPNANMTITGYRSSVAVTGATLTQSVPTGTWTQFDLSSKPAFLNVDEFRFTQDASTSATMTNEQVDQITITTPLNLPLTLIDFSALKNGNTVQLQWSTAAEQNTASFEIDRSSNGNDFSPVGSLTAAGNSSEIKNYTFTDIPPAGSWLYRLKMIDQDERFTYSPILRIDAGATAHPFSAWPNPFRQQLTLTAEAAEPTKTRLTIRDISGRVLSQQDLTLQKGINSFSLPTTALTAKGIYLLNLVSPHGQQTIRVLKNE